MKTLAKWLLRLVVLVIALAIIVPVAATFLIDQEDIKQTIDEQVFRKTGRHLEIDGDIGWRPGMDLNIYARDIRYQNADWASPDSAFTAGQLTARISLAGLFDGKVRIDRIRLDDAVLWVEVNDGQVNLTNPRDKQGREPGPVALPDWLEIGQVEISGSKIINVLKDRNFEIGLEPVQITNRGREEPLQLTASLRLQEAKFDLQGSLGSLQSLINRMPSEADLVARFGQNDRLTATGHVDDVLAWEGVDLALDGTLQSLDYLGSLFPFTPPAITDIVVNARLNQPGKARTMKLEAIDGAFTYAGVGGTARGEIGNLVKLGQIQLAATAEGKLDTSWLPERFADALNPGVSLQAELVGGLDKLALDIVEAEVEVDGVSLGASGRIEDLRGDWQAIPLTLDVKADSPIAEKLDIKMPNLGAIAGTANLVRNGGSFSLDDIELKNQSDLSNIDVRGVIRDFGHNQSGEVAIDAEVTPGFIASLGVELPVSLDTVYAKGQVHLDGQNIRLVLERAESAIPGAELSASGSIPDLKNPTTLGIDLRGTINQLAALGKEFDIELPEVSPAEVTATLAGADGSWHLEDINIATDNDGLKAVARGAIRDLGPELKADLIVNGTVTAARVARLVPAAADTLESVEDELTAIAFSSDVTGKSATQWALANINAESTWLGASLGASGELTSFTPLDGVFDISLRGATERQTALLEAWPVPPLDDIDISLKLPLPVSEKGIRDIRGSIRAQSARLELDGDISKLVPLEGRGFKLTLVADDVNALTAGNAIFRPNTSVDAGLEVDLLAGEARATGSIKVGNSDIAGEASWQMPGEGRPALQATLQSRLLDLVSLLPEAEKPGKKAPAQPQQGTRLIADTALVPAWADKLNANVDMKIGTLKTSVVSLNSVAGTFRLENGHLASSLSGVNGSGEVQADISLEQDAENRIAITLDSFPVDAVNAVSDSEFLTGGGMDIALDIAGRGNSVVALLEKGTGSIGMNLYNSRMKRSALNLVGGDLLTNIASAINPFAEKNERVGVECAALQLDLRDGTLSTENGIAMKTDRVTLLGSGAVTFPDEILVVEIAPKARKGLGVSASSIAKMVRIGGTLSSPSIESDAKGLLQSGAAIGAAMASGGLTLFAQGLYDRLRANSDVCAIARGDKTTPQTEPAPLSQITK